MGMREEMEIEYGLWSVKPIEFTNAEDYIFDISNISEANTGFIHALESNLFFKEASQLLVNAIKLFQLGYFDCALYSLRQSLEISIGSIYLTENPTKKKDWENLKNGFESNKMPQELKNRNTDFKDLVENMPVFFENIRHVQKEIQKYVHKQGYASFYQVRNNPLLLKHKGIPEQQLMDDFERFLKVCIGAVAVYRLSIDALPVVLMDEDILYRSGDFITRPYNEEFVDKYIGKENIIAYKTTKIYKEFYAALLRNEKQNEGVFRLIHEQYYNRKYMDDYIKQRHLCSPIDRIAICIFSISNKISRLYVNGIHWYNSEIRSNNISSSITLGENYFEKFFSQSKSNYNQAFSNVFISRCYLNSNYTYFEHNEFLTEEEITCINLIAAKFK